MVCTDQKIRILVVDDHPLMREGLVGYLSKQIDMEIVGEASNAFEAAEVHRKRKPDVTLMDLQLPGRSGIDAIRDICCESANPKVIALTTYRGDMRIRGALQAGASAYLLKDMLRTDLLQAIRVVNTGGRYLLPEIATEIAVHALDETLSGREYQVLREAAAGFSNKTIAERLSVAEGTVKKHIQSVLAKLSAKDRTEAVVIAIKRGLLDIGGTP